MSITASLIDPTSDMYPKSGYTSPILNIPHPNNNPLMPRRKISNTQAVCILLLWILLVYILLRYSPTVDFMTVFTIIASGIIVFVPLYKNRWHKDR